MRSGQAPPVAGGEFASPALPHDTGRSGTSSATIFTLLALALVVVIVIGVAYGPVRIPVAEVVRALLGRHVDTSDSVIIREIRLPAAITAIFCGAALGVAGLEMQTLFHNPLADPFVLGISAGASLGVAAVVLIASSGVVAAFASELGWFAQLSTVIGACLGAGIVMTIVLAVGRTVRSSNTLLLLGVMLSYLVNAAVTALLAGSSPQQVQQFVTWGFGSFDGVTWSGIRLLVPVLTLGMIAGVASTKVLNALLLGERYASTMGVDVRRARLAVIVTASILGGTVTAFAGPIAFLGIAIPHVARSVFRSSDHRVLVPACMLIGACLALAAKVVAEIPGGGVLPLNAVNALIGGPIVVVVLIRANRPSSQL